MHLEMSGRDVSFYYRNQDNFHRTENHFDINSMTLSPKFHNSKFYSYFSSTEVERKLILDRCISQVLTCHSLGHFISSNHTNALEQKNHT